MTIFKQLENLKKSILYDMGMEEEGSPEHEAVKHQLDAVNMLMRYVRDGNWAKKPETRDRIMYAIQHGYSAAAEKYDTNVASIKASVSQASERIKTVWGYPEVNILSLINDGKTEEATDLLKLCTERDTASQLFSAEVLSAFPKEYALHKVDGEEFLSSVKALRSVTTEALVGVVGAISREVFEVICYFLYANDPKCLRQTVALYRYLSLEMDTDDLAEKLNIRIMKEAVPDATAK